jgi:hypothetical protein
MPERIPVSDHIERLRRDAEEVVERVRVATDVLTSDQITWSPPEGGWSVRECLEHLSVTNALYADASGEVLSRAPRIDPARAPDFKPGMLSARFIRSLAPGKGRYKAPKPFLPDAESGFGVGSVERFFAVQPRLGKVIERMVSVDFTRTKVSSPVSSMIRFRIGDMMDIVLTHSKRHVQQAEKVLLRADFPSTPLEAIPSEKEE